jgi:hypothetical protein
MPERTVVTTGGGCGTCTRGATGVDTVVVDDPDDTVAWTAGT